MSFHRPRHLPDPGDLPDEENLSVADAMWRLDVDPEAEPNATERSPQHRLADQYLPDDS
jgi:hypothetical protein